jgi:hypothetical protein
MSVEPPSISSNEGICAWIGSKHALVNSQGVTSAVSFNDCTKTVLKSSIVRVSFFIKLNSHVLIVGYLSNSCTDAAVEVIVACTSLFICLIFLEGSRAACSRVGWNV